MHSISRKNKAETDAASPIRIKNEESKAAPKHGLTLVAKETYAPKGIPAALESAGKNAGVLLGLVDKVVLAPETAKHILLFSLRNELLFFGPSENWAKAGAAAAFSWNFEELGAQCAEMLLKLLKGSNAAEIAPASPRKIEYVLNLRTSDQLKIDFNPRSPTAPNRCSREIKTLLENSLSMVKEKAVKHGIQLSLKIESSPDSLTADE